MHTGRTASGRGGHQAGLAACLLAGLLTAMGGCSSPAANVGLPVRPVPVRPVPVRPVPGKHDCLDLSHAGFADRQTGLVVEGSGSSHDFMITTLALMRGRWLVTGAVAVDKECSR
jgi:hypothetical protein